MKCTYVSHRRPVVRLRLLDPIPMCFPHLIVIGMTAQMFRFRMKELVSTYFFDLAIARSKLVDAGV